MKVNTAFKGNGEHDWTPERVGQLSTQEIQQLRANAERLGAAAVVELCEGALKTRRAGTRKGSAAAPSRRHARHLVSRSNAFRARGVYLTDNSSSWSGVRRSDGTVVMSLWAKTIESSGGACSQLLWAPSVDGSRPWSESAA